MLTFRFSKADGQMTAAQTLTSGMVGKEVKLEYSSDWVGLQKTVVFSAGGVSRSVVNAGEVVIIPHEVLKEPRKHLYIGVYGVSDDGRVIPTVRVKGPLIEPGTKPTGDRSTAPSLPVWAQLQAQIDELRNSLSADAWPVLVEILRSAVYGDDRSEDIAALGEMLGCAEKLDGGETK